MDPALSIPEIRKHLCLFIRPSDYRACSLVSRAWFESIAPWIWYSMALNEKDPVKDLAILHKYSAFIRALNLGKFELPIEIYDWFDNLQVLRIYFKGYQLKAPEHIADLIRCNRSSLRSICVESKSDDNTTILRASHECLSLRDLHIDNLRIRERDLMESFLKICTRLTTLSLEDVEFEEETQLMLKDKTFNSLEQVKMDHVRGLYPNILRACPNLKALSIYDAEEISTEEFVKTVTTHCKQLCVLSCQRSGIGNLSRFEELVLTMPPMKYLQAMHSDIFQYTPYTSYSHHYKTLQAIEMTNRSKDNGKDIQTILSSCPNLRWFEGDFILAEDIKSGRPWVCQRLEHLQVEILVRKRDRRLDLATCTQLSRLKKLHTLNLTAHYYGDNIHKYRSLSLRLGEGLELLASLSKLEHFGVGCLRPEFREEWRNEEIEWIAQAWPNLEAIYYDYREDEMYSRLCKQLGVSRVRQRFPWSNHMDFIDL